MLHNPEVNLTEEKFTYLIAKIDENKSKKYVTTSNKPKKEFLLAPHQKAEVMTEAERIK